MQQWLRDLLGLAPEEELRPSLGGWGLCQGLGCSGIFEGYILLIML